MKNAVPGKLYGKYYEDTKSTIFSPELSDRGDYLGDLLPLGSTPSNASVELSAIINHLLL